jgi:hypothetical protein
MDTSCGNSVLSINSMHTIAGRYYDDTLNSILRRVSTESGSLTRLMRHKDGENKFRSRYLNLTS